MITQDLKKSITVVEFSICGVSGFKTMHVTDNQPKKRMLSAINYMLREIKEERKRLVELNSEAGNDRILHPGEVTNVSPEESAHLRKRYSEAREAVKLLEEIKQQVIVKQNLTYLEIGRPVAVLTTEQFITEGDHIYEDNVKKFLANVAAISANFTDHLSKICGRLNYIPQAKDLEPFLCICTGGIFGERPYYLYMTPLDAQEMGMGNYQEAIRRFCYDSLVTVKHIKLSEYLRLKDSEGEKIKQQLINIDHYIDTLNDVVLVDMRAIMSGKAHDRNKISDASGQMFKKVSDTLMLEAEYQLTEYLEQLVSAS